MVGTWQRLAHTELSSGASTIDSGTFTAKENLKIIVYTVGGNSCKQGIQFNSITTSTYAYRYSSNGGSDNASTSQSRGLIQGNTTTDNAYSETIILNESDKEKLYISHSNNCASGAGNAPSRYEIVGKWTESSDSITSIQIISVTGNNFGTGSYITVFGATGDTVTDEKTTLTNVPVNTRYEETDTRKIFRFADETNKTNIYNYWKMDSSTNTDTATTANGYTNGLGKNGTNSNITVDTSDKKIGTASYEFNGASSSTSKCTYGSASDWKFLHNGDDWSATFWAKLDSLSGGGEILSTMTGNNGGETGMHFYLHPDGGGEFTMQMFNGSGAPFPINSTVSSVFTTGTWNHYAVTFNGTTVTVYKDGVLKGTITKGSAGLGSGNPTYTLHMGDAGDGAVGELDGKLDDFAIWKTVLSASFIKTLAGGSPTDNLTGWKERNSA